MFNRALSTLFLSHALRNATPAAITPPINVSMLPGGRTVYTSLRLEFRFLRRLLRSHDFKYHVLERRNPRNRPSTRRTRVDGLRIWTADEREFDVCPLA